MKNEIGFVIWGTKRGESKFFSSDNIDINEEEIKNAIEDIRSQISFDEPKVEFYALEFTSHYKVFTVYYSVIDWGNRGGGYLAITIFIPKDKKLPNSKGPINLLRQFLQVYKDNYILDNYRLSPDKENVQLFYNILNQYSLENETNRRHRKWEASSHNEKIALLWYKSDFELKDFFNNPYRKEFLQFQEVIFIAENLPQKERMYSSGLTTIENLKHIEDEYNLKIQITDNFENKVVPQIKVNGRIESLPIYNLQEDDIIDISTKIAGHKPFNIRDKKPLELLSYGELSGKTISINKKLSVQTETVTFKLFEKIGFQDKLVEDGGVIKIKSEEDETIFQDGKAAIQDINPFKKYELEFQLNNYKPYPLNIKGSDLISKAHRGGYLIQLKPTAEFQKARGDEEKEEARLRLIEENKKKNQKKEFNTYDSSEDKLDPSAAGFKSKIFDFWEKHDIKILALTATLLLFSIVTAFVLIFSDEEETIVQEETIVHTPPDATIKPKLDTHVGYQYEFILKNGIKEIDNGKLTLIIFLGNDDKTEELEYPYQLETDVMPTKIIYQLPGFYSDSIGGDKLETTPNNLTKLTLKMTKLKADNPIVENDDDNQPSPPEDENKSTTLEVLKIANSTNFDQAAGALKKIKNCKNQYLRSKQLNGSSETTCEKIRIRLTGMAEVHRNWGDENVLIKNYKLRYSKKQKNAIKRHLFENFGENYSNADAYIKSKTNSF